MIEPCATADPSGQHISFRYIWTRAAIARAALNDNHHVVAAARNSNGIHDVLGGNTERLLPVTLDVTDGAAAEAAVAKAVDAFGRIDVLVNNAGYGQLGAFEEVSPDDIEKQFATNVFGLMNVTRAVLPVMRKQRSGYVFNMSSAAGYKGGDRYSIYAASKFAIGGFSESLSVELAEFGIHVTVVEPGYFRTDFLDSSSVRYGTRNIADYATKSAAKRLQTFAYNHRQPGDPAKLGKALVTLAANANPPTHFPVGVDAIQLIQEKNAAVQMEADRWRELSVSTAFSSERAHGKS